MNDLDTSFLTRRLHDLADELTPDVDVTTQVREARSRYRRQRRGRLAVLGTVAATVVVVGGPTALGALSGAPPHGQTAHPGVSTPSTSSPVADRSAAEQSLAEERLKAARTAGGSAVASASDRSTAEERAKAAASAAASAAHRPGG